MTSVDFTGQDQTQDIFRTIVTANMVEDQVIITLKRWFHTYLREIELQHGIAEDLVVPRSYNVRPTDDRYNEDQLPAIVLVSIGVTDQPTRQGDGSWTAPFSISIAVFASAPDSATVNRNIKVYAAAIRAIMLQNKGLVDLSDGTAWNGEDYEESPPDSLRGYAGAIVHFNFYIPNVVNDFGGPSEPYPDPDPGDVESIVEHTFLETDLEPVEGP